MQKALEVFSIIVGCDNNVVWQKLIEMIFRSAKHYFSMLMM